MTESEALSDFILNYLYYDKDNGKLYWKDHYNIASKTRFVGKEIGGVNFAKDKKKYYRIAKVNGILHRVHRLIYFIEMNVYDLNFHIDHIDGDTLNNKISNLRLVTPRKNSQNKEVHRLGKKLVGTSFRKDCGRWRAGININGKRKNLGSFDTEIEAHNAYMCELNKHLMNGGT